MKAIERMKRIMSLLLAITLFATVLVACSSSKKQGKGADSLEKLVAITMDYVKSGDYSKIKGVTDLKTCLAYFVKEGIYEMESGFTWEEASKKADLIMQGADKLKEEDPTLAQTILEEIPKTGHYVTDLQDAIDILCKMASCELDSDYYTSKYKDLECEFNPENISIGENNYNRYDLGRVADKKDSYTTWGLELVYYYDGEAYFFVGFGEIMGGGIGG